MGRKKTMRHIKSMHNGKRRKKSGDIFQPRPTKEYVRPCGCTNATINDKNARMMRVILSTRPITVWGRTGWTLKINDNLVRRFGRCIRHLSDEQKQLLRDRGMEV